mgnify:CR=1 FL=1
MKPISVSMRKRRLQWFGRVYHREEDIKKVADQDRGLSKAREAKKYDIDHRVRWHSLIELGSLQNNHPDRTSAVMVEMVRKGYGYQQGFLKSLVPAIFNATFKVCDNDKINKSITVRMELRYNTCTCIGTLCGCYEANIPYIGLQ